jgi:hypothetical protein
MATITVARATKASFATFLTAATGLGIPGMGIAFYIP